MDPRYVIESQRDAADLPPDSDSYSESIVCGLVRGSIGPLIRLLRLVIPYRRIGINRLINRRLLTRKPQDEASKNAAANIIEASLCRRGGWCRRAGPMPTTCAGYRDSSPARPRSLAALSASGTVP